MQGSVDSKVWGLLVFVAILVGVVVVRSSSRTVVLLQEQRTQRMSQQLNEDLGRVAGCLSLREVALSRDQRTDSMDQARNALVTHLNVAMPEGSEWKGAARRLTASWADYRASADRPAMRECVFFNNHLMIDTCCTVPSEAATSSQNPVCKVLAGCGRLQWE